MRNALVFLLPARGGVRMNLPGEIDARVLLATAGIAFMIVFVLALVPATQVASSDIAGALKTESGGVFGSKARSITRKALVIVQISLSLVLLVATGLLFRSLQQMRNEGPGFSQDNVLITSIDFVSAGYSRQRVATFQDDLTRRLRVQPAVESVAFSRASAFGLRGYSSAQVMTDRVLQDPTEAPTIEYNEIAPEYLRTLGISVISGREFTQADDASSPLVAVVNEKMAAELWPSEDPVGRKLKVNGKWLDIVGVAKTVRYRSLTESPQPFFYTALRQGPDGSVLQIRTSTPASTLVQTVRREVHNLDPNLALGDLITMRSQVERTTGPQRVAVLMVITFSALALMLAVIGLYGLMSYAVAQDSRELGLRVALGARPGDIARLVIARGAGIAMMGLTIGLAVALASSRLLGYLLYRVSPRDPLSFAAALILMFASVLLACTIPAMRASRTDPMIALRA
jgi:predicted permease